MQATQFGHLVVHGAAKNRAFYKDLFVFLGWKVLYDVPEILGVGDDHGGSLWFGDPLKDHANDYDGVGVNHIGIAAPSMAAVDETVEWLKQRGIPALFETPRHRAEYSASENDTYYQVMFESPDRVLFEVVYVGPKA